MSAEEVSEQSSKMKEFVVALLYAVSMVVCIIILQGYARDALSGYSEYVGELVIGIAALLFAMVLTKIAKKILKLIIGEHLIDRYFVLFSCVLLVICCFVAASRLSFWWLTAFSAVVGTVLSSLKLIFKRKVKKKVNEVREKEREMRHEVMDDMKDLREFERNARHRSIQEAKDLRDKLRGKK